MAVSVRGPGPFARSYIERQKNKHITRASGSLQAAENDDLWLRGCQDIEPIYMCWAKCLHLAVLDMFWMLSEMAR